MKAFVVIPARYGSSRLPGKLILPEAKTLTGKFLIEHVYFRVREAKGVQGVLVATDDRRIFDVVKGFGGEVVMTYPEHKSGTDRVAEVAKKIDADIIVNVQGDEPEVRPEMVDTVVEALQKDKGGRATPDQGAVMATLANVIDSREEYQDPHAVKVVMDNKGHALYFSRSPIPYAASWGTEDMFKSSKVQGFKGLKEGAYYKHLGIYSYRRDFLLRYSQLPRSPLEEAEKLEQLRVLSNGYKIKVVVTPHKCCGVDTPEDFRRFLDKYRLLAVGSQKPESRKRMPEGQVSR